MGHPQPALGRELAPRERALGAWCSRAQRLPARTLSPAPFLRASASVHRRPERAGHAYTETLRLFPPEVLFFFLHCARAQNSRGGDDRKGDCSAATGVGEDRGWGGGRGVLGCGEGRLRWGAQPEGGRPCCPSAEKAGLAFGRAPSALTPRASGLPGDPLGGGVLRAASAWMPGAGISGGFSLLPSVASGRPRRGLETRICFAGLGRGRCFQ